MTWRARPGEVVRLNGGERVTSWSKVGPRDPNRARIRSPARLYRARVKLPRADGSLPGSGRPFAELFYDGRPMELGAWPKHGWAGARVDGTRLASVAAFPRTRWVNPRALDEVNRPWAHLYVNAYKDRLLRIAAWPEDENAVELGDASPTSDPQAVWRMVNLLEEVTEPGEYWLDRERGLLYFQPPGGRAPGSEGEAVVSWLAEPLLRLDPSSGHLRFEGLAFESGQRDLVLVRGEGHVFERCTFRNAAGDGLVLFGEGHRVERAQVYGLGSLGIVVAGDSRGITISDTEVHHVGRYLHNWSSGVALGGDEQTLRNCALHDLPWSAISLGARHSVIELNEFYATQQVGCDSGTIYGGGDDMETVIRYNHFHDVPRAPPPCLHPRAAVYFDTDPGAPTDASGFLVEGNLIERYGDGAPGGAPGKGTGIINKGSDNVFRHNLFVNVDVPYAAGYRGVSGRVDRNQAWKTGALLPPGNLEREPSLPGPVRGRTPTRAGSIAVAGTPDAIPLDRIGIR